jgi:hypothetical protein
MSSASLVLDCRTRSHASSPSSRRGSRSAAHSPATSRPSTRCRRPLTPHPGSPRRSASHPQGSKVLPEPDPDGAVSPIIRGPLPPVEPRRRSSQLFNMRGSVDGNVDVSRRGSGELLFRPGVRGSTDGHVVWPGPSSLGTAIGGGGSGGLLSGGGSGGASGGLLAGLSASSPGGGGSVGSALYRVSGVLKNGGSGSGGLGSPGANGGGPGSGGLGSARGGGGGAGERLRSIVFKESLKQTVTYVVEKMDDDLADEDCFSDDGDGGGGGGSEARMRAASMAPIRMESISEPQQADLLGSSGISFRAGSQALLVRKVRLEAV